MTSTHQPLGVEGALALDDRQLITRAQLLAGPAVTVPSPAPDAGIVAVLAAAKAQLELLLADVEEVSPCCESCTATDDLTIKVLCAQEFGVVECRLAEIACTLGTEIACEVWRSGPNP